MENLVKFEAGKIYRMKYVGNSDLYTDFQCVKRTVKSVTFNRIDAPETLNKRIKIHGGSEYVLYGNYSMAPVIKAQRLAK